jgi:hypothetical protein
MSYIALLSNPNQILLKVMVCVTFNKIWFDFIGLSIVVYSNAIAILGLQDLYKLSI